MEGDHASAPASQLHHHLPNNPQRTRMRQPPSPRPSPPSHRGSAKAATDRSIRSSPSAHPPPAPASHAAPARANTSAFFIWWSSAAPGKGTSTDGLPAAASSATVLAPLRQRIRSASANSSAYRQETPPPSSDTDPHRSPDTPPRSTPHTCFAQSGAESSAPAQPPAAAPQSAASTH